MRPDRCSKLARVSRPSLLGCCLLLALACGRDADDLYFDFIEELPAATYSVESNRIDLGSEASRAFLTSGWRHREEFVGLPFVTAVAPRAVLQMLVLEPREVELTLRGRALGEVEGRRVRVRVNDEPVGEVDLTGRFEEHVLRVPESAWEVGRNRVTLEHPDEETGISGTPLSAWDVLLVDGGGQDPLPPVVRDGSLFLGRGSRLDYVVPLRPGSVMSFSTIEPAPPRISLYVRVLLEDPPEERVVPLSLGADGRATIPIPVQRQQIGLVSLMVGGTEDSAPGVRLEGAGLTAGPSSLPPVEACGDCNLLLISIDTLRADHLEGYGYPVPISPNVERLRGDSVLFEAAYAPAPSTLPSHAALLTGLNVGRHGASRSRSVPLAEEAVTLAEVLGEGGTSTAAITSGAQVDPVWRLDQGFDTYVSRQGRETWRTPFARTVEEALEWLDAHPERFFLFLHTYEVHTPYAPTEEELRRLDPDYAGDLPRTIHPSLLERINAGERPVDAADVERIVASYDAEIASVDRALGRLLDALKESDRYDDTLIVFTSDHGEEFGEHGTLGWHSHTLYDELLRVPLVIKYPGAQRAGTTSARLTRLTDVMPTALDVLAPDRQRPAMDGTSIHATGNGLAANVVFSEREWPRPGLRLASVRTRRWKLIAGPLPGTDPAATGTLLFDLARDPAELRDTSSRFPHLAAALGRVLEAELSRTPIGTPEAVEVPESLARQLRALGYIE